MMWDAWLRRRRWERRLDAEMRFHLEQQVRDSVRAGMTPEEARRKAMREFGAVELAKDECRDQRPFLWGEHLVQDARFALRSFRRNPGFALVSVLTLALAIGATTAVFAVVHAILLRNLPFPDSDRMLIVSNRSTRSGESIPFSRMSQFREWQQ
ncbi:MAG: permease prefix domain 1-containing protein, partial [Bryobacteraceae bacterium]